MESLSLSRGEKNPEVASNITSPFFGFVPSILDAKIESLTSMWMVSDKHGLPILTLHHPLHYPCLPLLTMQDLIPTSTLPPVSQLVLLPL